jgi:putative ABC transport system substrate-binding protein
MQETTMKDTTLGLIILLALGLLMLPRNTEAQHTGKAVRIGVLFPGAPPAEARSQADPTLDAFRLSRVAVLWNPTSPTAPVMPLVEQAARALGVSLHALAVHDLPALEQAFHAITAAQDHGLFVIQDPFLAVQRGRVIQFALAHRWPTMFPDSPLLEAGGLLSYGVSFEAQYRRAAVYVDKILRGARPADLPVEQPMRLELVINLKAAKALGLTIPAPILLLADKVIQ